MSKHYLDLSNVGMRFATPSGWFEALVDVDLKIAKGEFISLIGHSGCGKSTVLNLVAGLNDPTSGGIILDGREVAGPGPERSVVFQNHALLPWPNGCATTSPWCRWITPWRRSLTRSPVA